MFLVEKRLQNRRGGNRIKALFLLFSGKFDARKFALRIEATETLILKMDWDIDAVFHLRSKGTYAFRLIPNCAVHVQR